MLKITLFHLPNSRSQRILWLLEELELPYSLIFSSDVHPDLISDTVKPLKFPTIKIQTFSSNLASAKLVDEFYLTETSAIAEYLLTLCPNTLSVEPAHSEQYRRYTYWKNYADCGLMQTAALKQTFAQITRRSPFLLRPISSIFQYGINKLYLNDQLKLELTKINEYLKDKTWFCGSHFSLADIMMSFPLEACFAMGDELIYRMDSYPHIHNYLSRLNSRQAYAIALNSGQWRPASFDKYWNI